jgi:hypothetical protein
MLAGIQELLEIRYIDRFDGLNRQLVLRDMPAYGIAEQALYEIAPFRHPSRYLGSIITWRTWIIGLPFFDHPLCFYRN